MMVVLYIKSLFGQYDDGFKYDTLILALFLHYNAKISKCLKRGFVDKMTQLLARFYVTYFTSNAYE